MSIEIPQIKLDWLAQIAEIQGIPVEDLKKYYLKEINDPTCVTAFPREEDLLDYVDNLLATHIQPFHSAVKKDIIEDNIIREKYIDNSGYYRYKDNDVLIHRDIAYNYIYKPYPLKFSEYQVHHKNGNKLDNRPQNLEILTKEEHEDKHGWKFK